MNDQEKREDVLFMFRTEYQRATEKFGPFASYHEGYAVLKEEVEELWDEIKGQQRNDVLLEKAIQIGAMAMRFIMDLKEDHDE